MRAVDDMIPARYRSVLRWAARFHRGQRVPGAAHPYTLHLVRVAWEVQSGLAMPPVDMPFGLDADLALCCALLHDVVEDTAACLEDVRQTFGAEIAAGVGALTKNPQLSKQDRMQDSLERLVLQPVEVQMVKLGDRIVNLSTPPSHWSRARVAGYQAEASLILECLGGAHAQMGARLAHRIARYSHYLNSLS